MTLAYLIENVQDSSFSKDWKISFASDIKIQIIESISLTDSYFSPLQQ